MSSATFTLRDGVVYFEVEDGTSRLLDFGDRFYGLSVVATRMLRVALEFDLNVATEQLSREYGVPLERIRDDLTTFLVSLERKRLIRRTSDRCIATRLSRVVICSSIVPILWGAYFIPWQRGKVWILLILAWLSCRLLGWAHTVAAWRVGFPCRVALMTDTEVVMRAIDTTVRSLAASCPLPTECKERSLTTWALARITGVPAELVIGIHPFPLEGHCWCVYNDTVYSDDSERCAQFRPVWRCP